MLSDHFDQIETDARSIVEHIKPNTRIHVQIREGVPRRRLLDRIREYHTDPLAIVVFPSLLDPDISVHGLLQAAAHLGAPEVTRALDDRPLRDRARGVGQALAREGRALLVWVPAWRTTNKSSEADQQISQQAIEIEQVEDVLGGWLSVVTMPIVVLTHQATGNSLLKRVVGNTTEWRQLSLDAPRATLSDDAAWHGYAEAANQLRAALRHTSVPLTSQQLRLLVALVALGENPRNLLNEPLRIEKLTHRLASRLEQPDARFLAEGVQRCLLARMPVSRKVALEIARVPDEHQALITHCLSEPGDVIEIFDSVRAGLRKVGYRPQKTLSSEHLALADYHQRLDGAAGPTAAWQHIEHWLEKAHHLGRSGSLGEARWEELDLPTREFYWDRARSLSVDHHQYVEAAKLFQKCLDRFDRRDAYSWHYLGFNLDRAGIRRKDAEYAFREAVKLRPDHPWYNGRLVTFLIEQARFRAAEEEWNSALERMDPDGENIVQSPWLAKQAHRWVVKAWLSAGEVLRARAVFQDIPEESFSEERWYEALREAIDDAEEARQLGESVYPSTTPQVKRWRIPDEVPLRTPTQNQLRSWYPGRVVAVDDDGIQLALAVPHNDPEKRRLIARTLAPEEWPRYADHALEEGEFIFLAIYENPNDPQGIIRITQQPRVSQASDDFDMGYALRYVQGTSG